MARPAHLELKTFLVVATDDSEVIFYMVKSTSVVNAKKKLLASAKENGWEPFESVKAYNASVKKDLTVIHRMARPNVKEETLEEETLEQVKVEYA